MLRIALALESDGPGGAEVMLLRLASALRARGHEVVPILPAHRTGWLAGQFAAMGFAVEKLDVRRALDPSAVRELRDIVRRRGIDVFHAHEFTMVVYGAAATLGVPCHLVATMHGAVSVTAVWRRRIALRWALRRADIATTVSEELRGRLIRDLKLPSDLPLLVVANGVPLPETPLAVERECNGTGPLCICAVGNLESHKGHAILLDALAGLAPATPAWRLLIVGGRGGPERAALEAAATTAALSGRVEFLFARDDVSALLQQADLFAMPSLNEGLPMALLEAMSVGLPVIVTDVGGMPATVRDGIDGIVVPSGSATQMGEAIVRLLTNPELRLQLGRAARARVEALYSAEAMAAAYEACYMARELT